MQLFGNKILDVLLSLVLIYALLSILVSILIEAYNYRIKARAKLLHEAIIKMLKDPINQDWGHLFYNHHLIKAMKSPQGNLPQYIPASIFAEVLCDVLAATQRHIHPLSEINTQHEFENRYELTSTITKASYMQRFENCLKTMEPSPLADLLNDYWEKSGESLDQMKIYLADWFNAYMDRVSGWYKSRQKKKFLIAGTIIAVCLNIDSLHLIKILSTDDKLRTQLINEAVKQSHSDNKSVIDDRTVVFSDKTNEPKKKNWTEQEIQQWTEKNRKTEDSLQFAQIRKTDSLLTYLTEQEIPMGWNINSAPLSWFTKEKNISKINQSERMYYSKAYTEKRNHFPGLIGILTYILGIGISAVSLSFGAPFWFDMLMKLVNLRQSGQKPDQRGSLRSSKK